MRCCDQRAAGGEHRVDQEALTAAQIVGQTVRIRDLLGRVLLVALHAEEADFGGRNHLGHAVKHAQARAQHRHNDRCRGSDVLAYHRSDGGFDRLVHDFDVAGGFVSLKHHEFGNELAERGGRGVLVAKNG